MHGEGQTLEAGGQGTRVLTSNMPFMAVTLDVSKLSGWLNPLSCDAPFRVKRGTLNARTRGTQNMWLMSVTPEVSQLDMSALKFCKPEKRPFMSEMAETSQSAMGPHFAVAAVGLAL